MNYDPVAKYYDRLARLVFGKSIFLSQIYHFDKIGNSSEILIVGGGTGWILEYLPIDTGHVTFIESSPKMIEKARSRKVNYPVSFYQTAIEETDLQEKFDVIITHFFFDQFKMESAFEITRKLKMALKEEGIWLVTDFDKREIWWQKLLLGLMYNFFTVTVGMKTRHLLDWRDLMKKTGMEIRDSNAYLRGFMFSACYK